ncbi:hypothetical protein BURK1_00626 [Burkholderiales bacterium]|nr:hypothetical protein BURK1_00626 [Burkholderiales bacterium]
MPWSPLRYPPAMRGLPPVLRAKAIEIANAMLADGIDDGRALRMAIAAARRWGARRAGRIGNVTPPWLATGRGQAGARRLRRRLR